MLEEFPLVVFTVFAQMSVGSFVVLGLIHTVGFRVPPKVMDRVSDPALFAIGPLLVLGLAASTLHLGSPLRAANALRHLQSSWLSREILVGMLFAGLGATFAVCQWRKWLTPRLRQGLAVTTAVTGLVLVYFISRVYSLRTVPAWDTWHTVVRFYATTFLLGFLAVGVALVVAYGIRTRRGDDDPQARRLIISSLRGIAVGSILVLGVKFVGLPSYLGGLATSDEVAAHHSLDTLAGSYGGFSLAQTILVFAGVAVLGIFLAQLSRRAVSARALGVVAGSAFVLVLAGEVIGRMLFYASMVRVGM